MSSFKDVSILVSRLLLSILFIVAGYGKLHGYEATAGYMEAMHVPSQLLPLVILLELGGGLALVFGFLTSFTAISIGIFSIVAALIFHADFSDQTNQLMLMKDFGLAGGFFLLASTGSGRFSIDALIQKRRSKATV